MYECASLADKADGLCNDLTSAIGRDAMRGVRVPHQRIWFSPQVLVGREKKRTSDPPNHPLRQ